MVLSTLRDHRQADFSATNKLRNESLPAATQIDNSHTEAKSTSLQSVNQPDNLDGKSLAREMIDLLKDQIRVKDHQLQEQGEQIKESHELNLKLSGTMVQQFQKIENLLRLTKGVIEVPDVVTKDPRPVDGAELKEAA